MRLSLRTVGGLKAVGGLRDKVAVVLLSFTIRISSKSFHMLKRSFTGFVPVFMLSVFFTGLMATGGSKVIRSASKSFSFKS